MKELNEVKIIYNRLPDIDDNQILSSRNADSILRRNWDTIDTYESFKVLLLDQQNKVRHIFEASHGGTNGTVVDAKTIFAVALKTLSRSIILAHNHPSGNLQPSDADRKLTNKLIAAGKVLDINVLDHLILTSEGYYSFGDSGDM